MTGGRAAGPLIRQYPARTVPARPAPAPAPAVSRRPA